MKNADRKARRTNRRYVRQILNQRTRTNRAAARINRRGTGSLTTHALATGLTPTPARSMASTLRKVAHRLGIHGTTARVHAGRRMRTTTRYTPAQVAAIAAAYRPRKTEFKTARARLALAA